MKKLLTILFAALLASAMALPALADVIWEPPGDFYQAHRDECTYTEDARYEAQEDAPLYESPEDQTQIDTISAGTSVSVEYVWNGSGAWGAAMAFIGGEDTGRWVEGWVELDSFRRLYGAADFEAEHADEIIEVDGDMLVTKESPTVFWLFPGSGEVVSVAGGPDSWIEEEAVSFNRVWTDEDGHEWGEVGYFYGIRNAWVYLPDPADVSLTRTAPFYAEDEEQPQQTYQPIKTVGPLGTAVVAVCAVAAVLIMFVGKKPEKVKQ